MSSVTSQDTQKSPVSEIKGKKNGVLTVETLNPGIQIVLGTSDTQTMWLLSCLYVVTFFQLEADFLNIEVDRGNFIFTGH